MKNKVIYYLNNLSYRQKLFASYVLLICIPFLLYVSINSYVTLKQTNKEALNSYGKSINQTSSYLEYKVRSIKNIIDTISSDSTIGTLINKDPTYYSGIDSTGNWVEDNGKITNILYNTSSNDDINQVHLYMANGIATIQETKQVKSLKSVENTDWYTTLLENKNSYEWYPSSFFADEATTNTLSFIRKIPHRLNINQLLGVLKADIPVSVFEAVIKQAAITDNTFVVLINSQNRIIAQSGNKSIFKTNEISDMINSFDYNGNDSVLKEISSNKSKYLMSVQSIDNTDWLLTVIVPKSDLILVTKQTFKSMLMVFVIILPFTIPLSYFVAQHNTKRIRRLISKMNIVGKGEFDIKITPSGNDEIDQMAKKFNQMVSEISILMNEKYKLGKERKAFELSALQSQIKPHFLYNSLDMINWMAIQSDVPEIAELVQTLATFYKLSLNSGKAIVTIEDELNHIRAYVAIQNMRFENSINLVVVIPDELLQHQMLKLTMQPLIENSINHGILEKDEEQGTIKITASLKEDLIITIEDDGVGMTEEELSSMFISLPSKKHSGYGVKNINERIKINYGDNYGLRYVSQKGMGTKVDIILPSRVIHDEMSLVNK